MLYKLKTAIKNRSPLLLALLTLVPFICVFPLFNDRKRILKYILTYSMVIISALILSHLLSDRYRLLILLPLIIIHMIIIYKIAKQAPLNEVRHKYSNWKTAFILGFFIFGLAEFVKPATFKLTSTPSQSMLPTLKVGDFIYVDKTAYYFNTLPKRGDVVLFNKPKDTESLYIGRIAGLPFEKITFEGNKVFINSQEAILDFQYDDVNFQKEKGKVYSESYPDKTTFNILLLFSSFTSKKEISIKDGEYFILGDNRNNSYDSRFYGSVQLSAILGQAKFVYFNQVSKSFGIKVISNLDFPTKIK